MRYKYKQVVLTKEQSYAIDLAKTGEDIKIEAFAGSGKTFLLDAISYALASKKGFYVAFNKVIATEAQSKFPKNVTCRTAHSLAYGKVGWQYRDRLEKLMGSNLSDYITLKRIRSIDTKAMEGNLILDTIRHFCYSKDTDIKIDHVPSLSTVLNENFFAAQVNMIKKNIVQSAKKVWKKMCDPDADMPITHDVYLKIWGLNDPVIDADFILFDEAQDANPVLLDIVGKQKAQKIYVGDRYQQIYSWRGAVNAIAQIKTKHKCIVSQSFRFGSKIAQKANEILNVYLNPVNPINIKGLPSIQSSIKSLLRPQAIICRTNGGVVDATLKNINRHSIFIQGGAKNILRLIYGLEKLKFQNESTIPELKPFKTWEDLTEYIEMDNGADLKSIVNIMQSHDVKELKQVLTQTEKSPEFANIVITTCHKAKGMQWKKVQLFNDFKYPKNEEDLLPPEEVNILYVAITRASHQLDITECKAANPRKLAAFRKVA